MIQSKLKKCFSNNGNLALLERKYPLDKSVMIKSGFIFDMIKETKRVRKIGTKLEDDKRVIIKKDLQKKFRTHSSEPVKTK